MNEMADGYLQLGVGGFIAVMVIKEVLGFLGKWKKTDPGNCPDVIDEDKCSERRDACVKSITQSCELLSTKVEGSFGEIKTSIDTMGEVQIKQQERLEKGDQSFQDLCLDIQHLSDLVEQNGTFHNSAFIHDRRKGDKKRRRA